MAIIAACPKCAEERYRGPEGASRPEEFVPVNGAPPPTSGRPFCHVCNSPLTFGTMPEAGSASLRRPRSPSEGAMPVATDSEAVHTLFAVAPGEDIRDIRNLPGGKLLVITTRRVVVIDVDVLSRQELPHAEA